MKTCFTSYTSRVRRIIWTIVILILWLPISALADGIIIPEPPICIRPPCPHPSPMKSLVIRYHHVTVSIQDQVAITHIDQVFYNPDQAAVEGVYLFPIPAGAFVTNFTLWIDGQPQQSQLLDAEQARQTYNDIVRNLRDPALLEYAGTGAVKVQLYPIPPAAERRIELQYSQALAAEDGLVRYIYPLSTEKFSALPLENVSVNVNIQSNQPIRAIYSFSHAIEIQRLDQSRVTVSYAADHVLPDTDFNLFYSVGESEAFHLLTYRDPDDADPDGYFLLMLAPRPTTDIPIQPKDVLLVLDRSGSMEGEKFQQAQEALRYILKHLGSQDRFNIIAFSTGLESYATSLRPAEEAVQAMAWVDQLSAVGSTDINRALLEAAAQVTTDKPFYLIFITDGLPTEGITEREIILNNFSTAAGANIRLFTFGVGYDVDTFLLDTLAQEHHGASKYVQPGQRLDEVISSFYAQISTPVLTDLELNFGNLQVYDIYPSSLPDLFMGSQILVTGRYRQGGITDVLLTGMFNGQEQIFTYPSQNFTIRLEAGAENQSSAIPRLWATRKIGYLLNQLRLINADQPEARQEIIAQIVRISIRFGIITPYTSYLVTDPMPLGENEQDRIADESYNQLRSEAPAPVSGQSAVQKSIDQSALSAAQAPATLDSLTPVSGADNEVRQVGARTFVRLKAAPGSPDTVSTWIDTAFDPQQMQTIKITFLSDEYFRLAAENADLAAAFALGEKVIVVSNGVVYEVIPESDATAPTSTLQPTLPALQITPTLPGVTLSPTIALPSTSEQEQPGLPVIILGTMVLGLLIVGWALTTWAGKNRG